MPSGPTTPVAKTFFDTSGGLLPSGLPGDDNWFVHGGGRAAILIMTTLHKVLHKSQARLYNTVGNT
jgi:hypothetical protein